MNSYQILLLSTAFLLFTSCARPVLIVQASSEDLQLEVDAFVDASEDLEIAYDFWSPDGIPFISMRNLTEDTLFLDLRSSSYKQRLYTARFDEFIGAGSGAFTAPGNGRELKYAQIERRPVIILAPLEWASFYAPSCYEPKSIKRGDPFTFKYVYLTNNSTEAIVAHKFTMAGIDRIKQDEISNFERTRASPDLYYLNQDISQDQQASYALEVLNLLANLLTAFY